MSQGVVALEPLLMISIFYSSWQKFLIARNMGS
jgi:hypothetical protein